MSTVTTDCPGCHGEGVDVFAWDVENRVKPDPLPKCERCDGAGQVDDGSSDTINGLMLRCVAARNRCEQAYDEFQVIYDADPGIRSLWRVGFYEREQGKQVHDDVTLEAALRWWLHEYEHRWDTP